MVVAIGAANAWPSIEYKHKHIHTHTDRDTLGAGRPLEQGDGIKEVAGCVSSNDDNDTAVRDAEEAQSGRHLDEEEKALSLVLLLRPNVFALSHFVAYRVCDSQSMFVGVCVCLI